MVRVTGGEASTTGRVAQCRATCWNAFPVRFDDDGVAQFQYQLEQRDCRPTDPCLVRTTSGERMASAFTVFGGPAPPSPQLSVDASGPVEPGAIVTIGVAGVLPDTPVRVSFCADGCGPERVGTTDGDGRLALEVRIGGRCDGCGILVVAGPSRTLLPVTFAPPPTPGYDAARLVGGLALAAALLLMAWRLIATTDWRPPSEAAVPDPDLAATAME